MSFICGIYNASTGRIRGSNVRLLELHNFVGGEVNAGAFFPFLNLLDLYDKLAGGVEDMYGCGELERRASLPKIPLMESSR